MLTLKLLSHTLAITWLMTVFLYSQQASSADKTQPYQQLKDDNSSQMQIKGTLKASCSLTLPPPVDLGEIPIATLEGNVSGKASEDFAKTFKVGTSCAGTNKYSLEFNAEKVSANGCLEADTQELAFCLSRDGKAIDLADEGARKITGDTSTKGETIKVIPAQGSKKPTAGEHAGSMTVTITPL
ncbi:P pilus assembly protein, pilin FimA [Serratia fonticola]|uniref:hypothetical protein n=1 Tax=Serratia fonticola TaxID=47917 RepID=UPI002183AAAE|nr:hypothetical protein [Serratia fonticola]CAI2158538.1 P pilus assembly protein, pilin FimA [Serratia fonticola]